MELGNLSNRLPIQTLITPTQTTQTPQEKVEVKLDSMLNRWNYSPQELNAIKQCFLTMRITEEAKNNPDVLAQKQLRLLEDMDKYPDLRVACFDLTPVNSSGCDENVFPLFLELQDKLREMIANNPTVSALFERPQHHNKNIDVDSYNALQSQRRTEFGWQGRTYNKNSPSPKELAPHYKSQPYISITRVPLTNLNDQVCFLPQKSDDPTTKKIVCRHFATQFIKDTLQDKSGSGKVNLTLYSTEKSIAQHIPIEIETTYNTLRKNAKRYELINNDKFGQHLCTYFLDMQRPEKQETIKALLICSPTHVMAARLLIKGTKGNLIYVVTFYDSTKTNVVVRSEAKELSTFKNYSLKQFINGSSSKEPAWYEAFYDGIEPISLLMECNLASLTENVIKKKKVLQNFAPSILTSTHLFFLLSENFAQDLAGLQSQLQKIGKNSPEKLLHLLFAKNPDGTSGLYMALQDGHADAINAYGKLLQLLHKPELGRLLDLVAAKTANGTPGLHMALQQGHADAVRAYANLLQVLVQAEPGRLVGLLAAKNAAGTPALYMALQKGHADTVQAYGELLQLFPQIAPNKLIDLLFAKMADGTPGLYVALQNGHTDTVKAFGKLLQLLDDKQRGRLVDLIATKAADGVTGLYAAMQQRHGDIIEAFGELVHMLHEKERTQLCDLLEATDINSGSWLNKELENEDIEIIKLYKELVSAWRFEFAIEK